MAYLDWLPFAVGAVVRALWLRFKVTSRRVSVTEAGFGRDRSQVTYTQIKEVRSVARGFGAYGDMVLVLNDGARLGNARRTRFREMQAYIEERMASKGKPADAPSGFTASNAS